MFSTPTSSDTPALTLINHYDPKLPNRLKFDIRIAHWEWKSPSNRLALQFDVLSEKDPEAPNREFENGVELEENAYFESATTAIADENPVSVGISIDQNSVYLAYPHFDNLEHDPVIGFRGVPGVIKGITTTNYGFTVLFATALIVIVVYSRRR